MSYPFSVRELNRISNDRSASEASSNRLSRLDQSLDTSAMWTFATKLTQVATDQCSAQTPRDACHPIEMISLEFPLAKMQLTNQYRYGLFSGHNQFDQLPVGRRRVILSTDTSLRSVSMTELTSFMWLRMAILDILVGLIQCISKVDCGCVVK